MLLLLLVAGNLSTISLDSALAIYNYVYFEPHCFISIFYSLLHFSSLYFLYIICIIFRLLLVVFFILLVFDFGALVYKTRDQFVLILCFLFSFFARFSFLTINILVYVLFLLFCFVSIWAVGLDLINLLIFVTLFHMISYVNAICVCLCVFVWWLCMWESVSWHICIAYLCIPYIYLCIDLYIYMCVYVYVIALYLKHSLCLWFRYFIFIFNFIFLVSRFHWICFGCLRFSHNVRTVCFWIVCLCECVCVCVY